MNHLHNHTDAHHPAKLLQELDRDSKSRSLTGGWKTAMTVLFVLYSVTMIVMALVVSGATQYTRLPVFVGMTLFVGYLKYPASKRDALRDNYFPWYDVLLAFVSLIVFFYYAVMQKKIIQMANRIGTTQILIGIIGILLLVELCRRSTGVPLIVVVGLFTVYGAWWLTNNNPKTALRNLIYNLFYNLNCGIFSSPITVCASFIVLFIILGSFLEKTGIGTFFVDLANSIAGASVGGPAKVAVISSALEGMYSGSSVANTVGSGSITIPTMKKVGYKPEFAAAVEAAASTGGQIMPPIMGAAAFLMTEYVNEPYGQIAVRAILPAVLYFLGIFIAVHLEAKKFGLRGIPRSELPKFFQLIRKIYLLAPLVILIYLVTSNSNTIQVSASIAIIVAVVASLFDKDNRITPKRVFEALAAGARGTITVAVACGIAGVIAGCITVTGLGSKLISGVIALSGGNVMIGLVLTMICCIILGMGVPTTANYCIMATTCAPILQELGVNLIAAHFFVFYFGIVADITPPVALAAYAGSAIAKSNPMKTGVQATKLAIGAFIVPYVFALNPSMLFINASVGDIVLICATAVLGMFGIAAAMNGYLFKKIQWYMRIAFMVGGLMLLIPGLATDIAGLVLLAALTSYQYLSSRKGTAPAA